MFNVPANDQHPAVNIPAFAGVGGGAGGGWFRNMSFQLPLGDLGSGAVDTTPARAIGSGTPTFTRATTAWTKLSSGLWAQVNSGVARSCYLGADTTVGAYGGYLAEGARTNEVLWSRDLTNAAWVKTTATAAKDQTGIDGSANSASSLTATAGNATCLQVITEAAATREFSAFVKRITGTGEIDMTEDGGLTWTNITASINSSTYTRVTIPAQSFLNPSVGFRIVTNGDKIAVDMCQNEAGSFASSPIPTTTVAVTRNADVLTYAFSGNASAAAGSAYAELLNEMTGVAPANLTALWFAPNEYALLRFNGGTTTAFSQFNTATSNTKSGLDDISTGVRKRAGSWGAAGLSITGNGLSPATAVFDNNFGSTNISIGHASGAEQWFGTIRNVRILTVQVPDAVLQSWTI